MVSFGVGSGFGVGIGMAKTHLDLSDPTLASVRNDEVLAGRYFPTRFLC
jgi:hypothetical protein